MYQPCHFFDLLVSLVIRRVLCVRRFLVTQRTQRIPQSAQGFMQIVVYDRQ